jgi:hypothetical protein
MSPISEEVGDEPRDDDILISADHLRRTMEQAWISTFIEEGHDPEEAYCRAVIALLEHGHIPSRLLMWAITGELKGKWWPRQYAQMIRETQVERDRIIIDAMAEALRRKGLSPPRAVAEAKRELARKANITTEALRKRRQRQKKRDISQKFVP